MSAVLLGWDPVWPEAWQPDYFAAAMAIQDVGVFRAVWDVSATPGVEPGSDAWFVLPGDSAGVAGHGVVVSYPYQISDDEDEDQESLFTVVDLDIDLLLPLGEQVPLSELVPDQAVQTGTRDEVSVLDSNAADALRAGWGRQVSTRPAQLMSPVPGTLPQHALRWSLASRYENDPDATRVCLVHHGPVCSACGFDFAATFGEDHAAADMMQVHHIVPPGLVDDGYELDPVTDLVPLCPNCHAVAHSGIPIPYTPAELRRLLEDRGRSVPSPRVQGMVLSPERLQAQSDAKRLLRMQGRRPD